MMRIGHRPERDKRITTHVALVSRAFGADKIIVDREDQKLMRTINNVTSKFGGNFAIEFGNYREKIREFNGLKVHLTMYGVPLEERISSIKKANDIMVIVGSEKVPREIYELADMNIAVKNQPHSEVSALAIFLEHINREKDLRGYLRIIPQEKGKKVLRIPDRDECIGLLKKYGADDRLLRHSEACARVAINMGSGCGADVNLIQAGALLHDIGRTVTNDISHGVQGYRILKREGYDEIIARFCSTHVGAGLLRKTARKFRLPDLDYIPRTLEEKIVCNADTLLRGSKVARIEEICEDYRNKGLASEVPRLMSLYNYLERKCKFSIETLLSLNVEQDFKS
ncbi:MAG: HDIG domain-containing protein [Thermoplasmatales archaeon]